MAKKGEKVDISGRKNFPKDTTGMKYKRHVPKSKDKRKNNHQPEIYKDIDLTRAADLCQIGCTEREVASFLEVHRDSLRKAIKERYDMTWKEFFDENSDKFKVSLRRLQYRSATGEYNDEKEKYIQNPSVQMQIWLGRQYLDQKEKTETEITEKTNIPLFEWGTEEAESEDITDQKAIDEKKDNEEKKD